MEVYTKSRVFLMAALSAITPKIGLVNATDAVETAIPKLHNELAVKGTPKETDPSPNDSLNRNTKYTGKIAATPLVANAELAQSYIHQARMILFWFWDKFFIETFICAVASPFFGR